MWQNGLRGPLPEANPYPNGCRPSCCGEHSGRWNADVTARLAAHRFRHGLSTLLEHSLHLVRCSYQPVVLWVQGWTACMTRVEGGTTGHAIQPTSCCPALRADVFDTCISWPSSSKLHRQTTSQHERRESGRHKNCCKCKTTRPVYSWDKTDRTCCNLLFSAKFSTNAAALSFWRAFSH